MTVATTSRAVSILLMAYCFTVTVDVWRCRSKGCLIETALAALFVVLLVSMCFTVPSKELCDEVAERVVEERTRGEMLFRELMEKRAAHFTNP